jgi:hypothetical protein
MAVGTGSTMDAISGTNEGDGAPGTPSVGRPVTNRTKRGGNRSKITNGTRLLPTTHSQSVWGRLLSDTRDAMYAHLGGEDRCTPVQKITIRRIAALEAELIYLEDSIARTRHEGKTPDHNLLDLYARLGNAQRRHLEPLGWQSVPRDVTPALSEVLMEAKE